MQKGYSSAQDDPDRGRRRAQHHVPAAEEIRKGQNRVGASRLQEIATVLRVPLAALFGSDSAAAASRTENLGFLDSAGAMRLMRAYAVLPTSRMKRALVTLAERIAGRVT